MTEKATHDVYLVGEETLTSTLRWLIRKNGKPVLQQCVTVNCYDESGRGYLRHEWRDVKVVVQHEEPDEAR